MRTFITGWLAGIGVFLASVALIVSFTARPVRTSVHTSVVAGELVSGGAMNEAANGAITARLNNAGQQVRKLLIVSERVHDGQATVVEEVTYGHQGVPDTSAVVTVILYRSLWQIGGISLGAPPGFAN